MARRSSKNSNPGTAVLKTPRKVASPVSGSGTTVVKTPASKSAVRNPSGNPSVTRLKGQGPASKSNVRGADETRNK
jgi:hypothetical protein